ncbi:hypothetical protein [Halobacillus salinus]|uniref:hypothetical protein n=1 Tax=Halobacillus salinus TaxID=192814 RepID=UPI001F4FAC6B|nr:hypothetical protein [Halobacillus salinus]
MATVGILGMTHDPDMQKKYGYPLDLVEELITEFNPDVICGEVEPRSFEHYIQTGDPYDILGETQEEYPSLIFPYCEKNSVEFVPVNWFEEDVFQEEPFDRYSDSKKRELEIELSEWNKKQLSTWNSGKIPLNSQDYDLVTKRMYDWLYVVNPEVQQITWNARHAIMVKRVKQTVADYSGKRILCIHGADHNYWYYDALAKAGLDVVYPLR